MNNKIDSHYFLGANSSSGFFSLYNELVNESSGFFYILKGGPGCGKSSFMRKIAAEMASRNYECEYIHCSGDPKSLDAVYFPQLKVGFVDGTAPHALEPKYPAVSGQYINLGEYYNVNKISKHRDEIIKTNIKYKQLYNTAYQLINSAVLLRDAALTLHLTPSIKKSIEKRASGIITREFKKNQTVGATNDRFISAICCEGNVSFLDTFLHSTEHIYLIDNELNLSRILLDVIHSSAIERGYRCIRCLSPITPQYTEHLIIPELSLAFISGNLSEYCNFEIYRHIRLDALAYKYSSKDLRAETKRELKTYDLIISDAVSKLYEAKKLHDKLEDIYNPYVDFDGIYSLADKYIKILLDNSK